MTLAADINTIQGLQVQMIAALDRQDVAAIEVVTSALTEATARLQGHGALYDGNEAVQQINQALRHNDAVKTRLAFLADRNRQKIDALAALRSGHQDHRYKKP
jgi:hypothetical protein